MVQTFTGGKFFVHPRAVTIVELPAAGQRNRRAFTLVELLVVIGIIAVLIGILLPVLGSARRQAATAKCATQMRELGNSLVMYAQENRGYLPPVRLETNYTVGDLRYDKDAAETPGKIVKENAKWWHFLGKYLTKGRPMAQTSTDIAALMNSAFWCPSFAGYTDAGNPVNLVGGINRNFTGRGMNWYPSFRPDSNFAGDFPPDSDRFADCLKNGPASRGTWYKLVQFTKPGERALLADSRQFYLEVKKLSAGDPIPGQRLLFASNDYSSSLKGQAMHDFYRHGTYPG